MSDSQPGLSNVIWGLSAVEYRDMSLCWWGVRPESCFHVDQLMQSFEQVPSEWPNIKISMWHPLLLLSFFAAIILYIILGLFAFQFSLVEIDMSEASPRLQTILSPFIPIYGVCSKHIKKNMFFLLSSRYFLALLQLQSTFWILLDHSSIFFIILHQCSPSSISSCSNILFHHFCRSYPMTRWPSPFHNTPCRGRPWPASVKRWSVDPWSSWRHPISPRASKGLKNLTENSRNCSALEALDN